MFSSENQVYADESESVVNPLVYKHPNYDSSREVSIETGTPIWMSIPTDVRRGYIDGQEVRVREWRGHSLSEGEDFYKTFRRELHNWERASAHPNIEPFIGVSPGVRPWPSLITPNFERGNIMTYLAANPKVDPLPLLIQIADALAYMHSLSPPVIHRLVRGSNIMISRTGDARLIDLCIGELPLHPALRRDKSELRRYRWTAPEVALEDTPSCPESDVYSFGMTMLEVLSGQHPYAKVKNHTAVIINAIQGDTPARPVGCAGITDELWTLMSSCWRLNPKERPTMAEIRESLLGLCPRARIAEKAELTVKL